MIEPAGDPRVDELRQRLRALGYLDGGVDRFVLASARARRNPAAIAILASLRTGVLAAALLGPAVAIGLHSRLPSLVTGTRDAMVIALYMGVLLGAAVCVVSFAVSFAVCTLTGERVARRARPWSVAAGVIVSVASLTYLTLWWGAASAGAGSPALWTALALGVAVGISLLLGHAVSVTTLAAMMSGSRTTGDAVPQRTAGSWKASLAWAALAFAGAAALLVITARSDGEVSTERVRLTVVSTGLRVRVMAIDGLDPGLFDDLAAAGRLPALSSVLSGSRGRLAAEATRDPARIWTTIATGQPPERHGVEELETRRVAGVQGTMTGGTSSRVIDSLRGATDLLRLTSPAIASGTERREKAFWEVAADAGLRTAVINWWATWPAPSDEATGGPIVLSDRATLRLERGGALNAEIAPPSLFEALRPRWRALRDQANARAAVALESRAVDEPARKILQRSAELDAIQLVLANEVAVADPRLDLISVYLPGLDIVQHALLAGGDQATSPSLMSARLGALREYYGCLDRLLADALEARPGELVLVVTQPGRVDTAADGLIGMAGLPARPRAAQSGRSMDVTPTVLHALGVPLSRTLAGTPLLGLMTDAFVSQHPVRTVAQYGSPAARTPTRAGQALDQEALDRLRSLGYLK